MRHDCGYRTTINSLKGNRTMPATDPNRVVTNPQLTATAEVARVKEFWTPTRIEEALPLPLPTVFLPRRLKELQRAKHAMGATTAAGPVISEPSSPDQDGIEPTASGFDTHLVGNLSVYPYAIVGKLYMTFGTSNYVGSAWVIGESTVFTAGHCVHDKTAGWAKNVLFRAQYNNGSSAGDWPLGTLASLSGWTQDEDFEFDMGMGIAATPIRPVTGKAGWIANVGQIQGKIRSVGYPAQAISGYAFDGQRMWECNGDHLETEDGIIGMSNNMTGGCSGGPGYYPRSGQQYAIWVNSFRYTSEPNILRSPYFATNFLNLIQWMNDNGGNS
jgi:V8-like Glu-specific endopeptidase